MPGVVKGWEKRCVLSLGRGRSVPGVLARPVEVGKGGKVEEVRIVRPEGMAELDGEYWVFQVYGPEEWVREKLVEGYEAKYLASVVTLREGLRMILGFDPRATALPRPGRMGEVWKEAKWVEVEGERYWEVEDVMRKVEELGRNAGFEVIEEVLGVLKRCLKI